MMNYRIEQPSRWLALSAIAALAALMMADGALAAAPTAPAKADKAAKVAARKEKKNAAAKAPEAGSARQIEVRLKAFNADAMRRAIADMASAAPAGKAPPAAPETLLRLVQYEKALPEVQAGLAGKDAGAEEKAREILDFQAEVLLSNPLLNFDKLLLVRRAGDVNKSLPANWVGDCSLPRSGFDDEIAVLGPVRPDGQLSTVYKPANGSMVADVDLHWDAGKMLFSAIGKNGKWQVHEVNLDGSGLREATKGEIAQYDNYDAAYTADDRILFVSNAVCRGVPCIGGASPVGNIFRMNHDGGGVRQLCFDQDHNWYPTQMPDGSVLYTRWEYTDTPHYFTRLLFRMNPDGTGQAEYYGSNSFWPNSIFYARPMPGSQTKVVAVVSGHHGEKRMGELVIFDNAKGRQEADGVVQRLPGWGRKVEPVIKDQLVSGVYPRFLTPWPLSEKYVLAAAQLSRETPWGIYLVDVFDNMTLIKDSPGNALLEPIPLVARPRPPVIPDRVDLTRKDAVVYLLDVYRGPGLAGVPRGTVRSLRIFEYHYSYNNTGGHGNIGVEGPWDIKRILGTVPVEPDGSAVFRVPANTPLAVLPLDANGQALQLMRSWFTAMPGEMLSCVGCHERQSDSPPSAMDVAAARRAPSEIEPWYGPVRGMSFPREVQPVLDRYCVGCHDGQTPGRPNFTAQPASQPESKRVRGFTPSYLALHPYVRRPGPESDYHMLAPCEYRANTSELVQMLRKGHHAVKLDAEAWDRLLTWIDLNVPDKGTWGEDIGRAVGKSAEGRKQILKLYAGVSDDPEAIVQAPAAAQVRFLCPPAETPLDRTAPLVPGWPFDAAEAKRRQAAAGAAVTRTVTLPGGQAMELVLIPAGEYVMGDPAGQADCLPCNRVRIDKPFWIGRTEITNKQYSAFDPAHDSRYIDQQWKDHTTPGYPANKPDQPVIRISWDEAQAFCRWLSRQAGQDFSLPTEAQWEYAARAGSATALPTGDRDADFSKYANLADASIALLAVQGINPQPRKNAPITMDFTPREGRFNDGQRIVCEVGKYQPNAWGLLDMHGNVAEWTRTEYRPYPYKTDGRDGDDAAGERVIRGGSWADRPFRATSAFRLSYPKWQKVHIVGFRVTCPAK
jgi:formylglycine-generating enzyme required for sulfatase activity